MNDALMKQPEATTNEPSSAELSEPHFDQIAVLIAQPVEPIARRERNWFSWLEKPRMMLAILVVAAMLGTTALALTLQWRRPPQVEAAATEVKSVDPKTDEPKSQLESPLGAMAEQLKSSARRTGRSRARSTDTRPVARRVGVIVYGSSSGRP